MNALYAKMAARNLWLHKQKTRLAVLAVAACCFSLCLFQGYIRGTEVIFDDSYSHRSMLGDAIVRKDGIKQLFSSDPDALMTVEEQKFVEDYLAASDDVELSVKFLRVTGNIIKGEQQLIFTGQGVDVVNGAKMREPSWKWNTLAGRPLQSEKEESVLLGKSLAEMLGCKIELEKSFITGTGGYTAEVRPFHCPTQTVQAATATLEGQANALDLEVVGIVDAMFRELDQRYLYFPLSIAQRLLDTDRVSLISFRLKKGVSLEKFLQDFDLALKKSGKTLKAHSWKHDEVGDFYFRTMDFLGLFRNFMIVVILGVALLSIFNTFYRNVQERLREFGVMRTLGFKVNQVRGLFLLETVMTTLIGISIGAGGAFVAGALVNKITILYKIGLLTQPVPFLVKIGLFTFASTCTVVLFVSLVAAALPLWLAGKKKIVEVL